MTGLETNIFSILNLKELSSEYRLYRIKGLNADQNEYYQNCQHIKRKLSFRLQKPVTIIEREKTPYLVVRADAGEPPSPFPLVRTAVYFEPYPGNIQIDYSVRSSENDEICLRFLQFMLQEPLRSHPDLWQPAAGQPFFKKTPLNSTGDLSQYTGYSVRAVITPDNGLGLCVAVTSKFVSNKSLPAHISRDEFPKWKGRHCIYHYGHQWYEIQVVALDDRNATEYLIPKDGQLVSLLSLIVAESKKPIPPELAELSHDASVLLYRNNRDEDRGVPAPLCYLVYGTDTEEVRAQHQHTIVAPYNRESMAQDFVRRYILNLRFGTTKLGVAQNPLIVPPRIFRVPDYKFGQSKVLSVRGTPNTQHVSLDRLGATRLALLKEVGFYNRDPLDRQYFILPQSVLESYGRQFLADLREAVNELFPQDEEKSYDPVVVTYSDMGPRTFPFQSRAILEAVRANCQNPGYGVVMIHHTIGRRQREEDQLAAMVIRELRKLSVWVSVIHSTVGQESYRLGTDKKGEPRYQIRGDRRGKFAGYLRNVALNKVLLTNQRWPFILETRLNADVTIGIDVKQNTAGLVVVGSNGGEIRPLLKTSRQKEKLDEKHMKAYLVEILRAEAQARNDPICTVVLHRDGRTYQPELVGACQAMKVLKDEGVISPEATLTILEIPKTSPAPLRLFEVSEKNGRRWIENPQIGSYLIVNDTEGYVCTTGRAFPRRGTVQPLHVKRVEGLLSLEKCLEDIYSLSALAWTRPEDCTRYPITIKLNDRFLSEEATEYDEDALEIAEVLEEEVLDE